MLEVPPLSHEAWVDAVTPGETIVPEVAMMTLEPSLEPPAVARPPDTIEMAAVEDDQLAELVKSIVFESVNVPVAENCWVPPIAMSAPVGVTAMDTSVAGLTVSVAAFEVMPADMAVIADVPMPAPKALPCEPAALLMLATEVLPEIHSALPVKSWVVLFVYVPIAVNCCVNPFAILGVSGVTAIDTSAAVLTVKVVDPDIAPKVAVISDEPVLTVVARPLPPAALLIVATLGVPDIQVTMVVRSRVLLSVYVPVAVNCWVNPKAIDGLPGPT